MIGFGPQACHAKLTKSINVIYSTSPMTWDSACHYVQLCPGMSQSQAPVAPLYHQAMSAWSASPGHPIDGTVSFLPMMKQYDVLKGKPFDMLCCDFM